MKKNIRKERGESMSCFSFEIDHIHLHNKYDQHKNNTFNVLLFVSVVHTDQEEMSIRIELFILTFWLPLQSNLGKDMMKVK
jgi:hypothetical protein